MLFKLATRNIRRSVKDYAIYFVTLIIAVLIFYSFNSISDQSIMREIDDMTNMDLLELTHLAMNMFSVVVAFVLGFLIIYANQLLMKRRKSEFGIYMTLGMKGGQVSKIMLYETFLVGVLSLIPGLILGVLVSQFLSFATAGLFGVPMSQYQFEFSLGAITMTLLSFLAIYVIVAIFNVVAINRYKLIDLINARRQSQKLAVRNPIACVILFIVSIGLLAAAYWRTQSTGILDVDVDQRTDFLINTIMMLVGSLLFFFSLAGFSMAMITKSKRFYYRNLRPFTLRQVASKANTSFASIWVVCVMLFLAVTTFSVGMSLSSIFSDDINEANPFSASVIMGEKQAKNAVYSGDTGSYGADSYLEDLQDDIGSWDESVEKAAQLNIFGLPDMTYGQLIEGLELTKEESEVLRHASEINVSVVGVSQCNDVISLNGQTPIELPEDRYAILNNMSAIDGVAESIIGQNIALKTPSGDLYPEKEVRDTQLYDFSLRSISLSMVVPDKVIEALTSKGTVPDEAVVDINLFSDADEESFMKELSESKLTNKMQVLARSEMIYQAMGMKMLLTYLAVYIGLVLLVATAAVLAIQLLTLTIDSSSRYRLLAKLGCGMRALSGSLLAQVVIFFLAPMILAACHCACALNIMTSELSMIANGAGGPAFVCALLLALIYGIFMTVTFLASRSIVKESAAGR